MIEKLPWKPKGSCLRQFVLDKTMGQELLYQYNGGQVISLGVTKRGRKLPGRLNIVAIETGFSLGAMVYLYNRGVLTTFTQYQTKVVRKENFIHVLCGERSTRHYIQLLEFCWGLPIENIRKLYQEDRKRTLSDAEYLAFRDWYRNRRIFAKEGQKLPLPFSSGPHEETIIE